MATEILLLSNVAGLGGEGDVVKVAEGYARNYLIPRKLGAPVTAATRRRLAKLQRDRETERQALREKARALVADVEKGSYTIAVKVGAENKLYGSVTAADIVTVLHTQGFEVEKHAVKLEEPLRELGVYDIKLALQPDVEATIKVWIVEE